jgi:O-6-methylguanine DNA methyltransferase
VNEMDMEGLHRIVRKLGKSRSFHGVTCSTIDTNIGPVTVHACELGVISVDFGVIANEPAHEELVNQEHTEQEDALTKAEVYAHEAAKQLTEYFCGERQCFTVPLVYEGTEFQKAVWQALLEIPYGETRTYKDIAMQIGRPKAVRAVGQANRANPIAIIVPCHRVIGAGGELVGYAGSQVGMKAILLELEQRTSTGCA